MTNTLKVGVIGVGGISKTHMPGWAASEHAEVIAGADLMEPVLQGVGCEQHGVTKLYTNPADIINDPRH